MEVNALSWMKNSDFPLIVEEAAQQGRLSNKPRLQENKTWVSRLQPRACSSAGQKRLEDLIMLGMGKHGDV